MDLTANKYEGNVSVVLTLKVGEQKLVFGILSTDTTPQLWFHLVFDEEFELSHNWENGSVCFCGFQSLDSADSHEEYPAIKF